MIRTNSTKRKRLLCLLTAALVCLAGLALPGFTASAAETPTSLGLAEHGVKAHRDGWKYVSGAKGQTNSEGFRTSDCAGLIYAYFSDMKALGNCQGGATSQVNVNCVFSNDISEGIPNIHGLAITSPDYYDPGTGMYGHIGIYIGNNEAADNSDYGVNMLRGPVVGSNRKWNAWHVFDNGMKYPVDGWYAFDGKMVHYTNHEYDTNTVIDGYSINDEGFAEMPDGTLCPVDASMLSDQYAPATQVAAYLRTKYSGVDSTGELVGIGPVEPDPDCNGRITGNGVNVRKEANTDSAVVATLPLGTGVNILGETTGEKIVKGTKSSDVWYSVTTSGGLSGYVCSLYAEYIPTELTDPVIKAADGYVTMSAGTPNADIYYTTDCTEPTEESTPYTGPLYLTGVTYKAMAVKKGVKTSVTTATVLSNSSVFTDFTTKDWFFGDIDRAVAASIFEGHGNGVFSPNKQITRAQFVTALANLDRVDLSLYADAPSPFSDVKADKSKMSLAVLWAESTEVIDGFDDGTFRPGEPITREQMCAILARYAGLEAPDEPAAFADDSQISGWARDAVYACREKKLISGVGDNCFNPRGTATRAQACVITANLHDM